MTKMVKVRDPELIIEDLRAFLRGRIQYLEGKIYEKESWNDSIWLERCRNPKKKEDIDVSVKYKLNEDYIKDANAKMEAYESIYNQITTLGLQYKLLYEEVETKAEE